MEEILNLIEETALEELKKIKFKKNDQSKKDKADLQELLLDIEDLRKIETKIRFFELSLEMFKGTPTEKETIEAKIYALKTVLDLFLYTKPKLKT